MWKKNYYPITPLVWSNAAYIARPIKILIIVSHRNTTDISASVYIQASLRNEFQKLATLSFPISSDTQIYISKITGLQGCYYHGHYLLWVFLSATLHRICLSSWISSSSSANVEAYEVKCHLINFCIFQYQCRPQDESILQDYQPNIKYGRRKKDKPPSNASPRMNISPPK